LSEDQGLEARLDVLPDLTHVVSDVGQLLADGPDAEQHAGGVRAGGDQDGDVSCARGVLLPGD